MGKRGVVLIVTCIVVLVLLVLTAAFFASIFTEKKSVDTEKFALQALNLAESGANHAVSELRQRIRVNLANGISPLFDPLNYYKSTNGKSPLYLLIDYAYPDAGVQFGPPQENPPGVYTTQLTITQSTTPPLNNYLGISSVKGDYSATITIEAGTPTNPNSGIYVFPYTFSIESTGNITQVAPAISKKVRLLKVNFTITLTKSFAKYALFTFHHTTPSGTTVWFNANTKFSGPVHTNDLNDPFSFANNPSGTFTDEVTQVAQEARYYDDGTPVLLDADANCKNNDCLDKPIFSQGFQRGVEPDSLSVSLSQANMKSEVLGTMSEPKQNGVYVANDGTKVTGGIYIVGSSGLTMSTDSNNNPVYTISQGSTNYTVTVDYANQQTKITKGQNTTTYSGTPKGADNQGTLIYSNDNITSFSGMVQKDTAATVASEKNITITNNVTYQQYNPGPPLNATGYQNVLGILSWGGNVTIGTSAPDNVSIYGTIMAPNGVFSVDNYDSGRPRGVATLLGGVITNYYGAFGTFTGSTNVSGYGRNFIYDSRMLQGVAPPYFPYMNKYTITDDKHLDNKLIWQDEGV